MEQTVIYFLFGINYIIAFIAIYVLWRKHLSPLAKVLWSLLLLIPVVGPLIYGFSFNTPPPMPKSKRQGVHEYIAPGGKEIMDYDHGVDK